MKPAKHMRFFSSTRRGQSLVEVLVGMAIGIFLIIAGVGLIVPAINTNTKVANIQRGAALAKELLDNVRVWSEGDWHNVLALATGTANPYYLNILQSPFALATGTELVSSNPVTSGLVGWWKFDEGSGTVAYDFSGGNYKGTLLGNTIPTWVTGKIGPYALSFNGATGCTSTCATYGLVKTSNNITLPTTLSVCAWVYPNINETKEMILHGTVGGGAFEMYESSGLAVSLRGGSSTHVLSTGNNTLKLGQWNFICGTIASATGTIYYNGSLSATGLVDVPNTNGVPLNIGAYSSGGYGFNGQLDDVRIYNRVLSATEISQIYNSQVFTRYFYVSDVYRIGGAIVTGGGTYDPSTKQITVAYSWPGGPTYATSMYLTRNRDNIYDQTDWSGGFGASSSATSVGNQFATSSNIDYTTTTGSIYINIPGY